MCNNIFEEVKSQLNIRQVIEHYGIRIGRNGKFKCVFHNDKNPSASIKNEYFHCFVCGAGGDLITFTAKLHGLSNIDACKKLDQDFHLGLSQQPVSHIDRLKADRERAKRQAELKRQKEIENLIQHTGLVLASYHCYLWQGIHLYPFEHKRHIRGLQELTICQYYLDYYDYDAVEFCKNCKGVIDKYERELDSPD